ncbi:hypothetical protein [Streptomyces sp. KAU_LT]|uniref:hypothetical protein n=1 Tax=Streptomyces sp. KAU_LT TaxID=3046669 RepID=UPI0024B6A720|nr:hypothetical protein [Streptomyces sp. KAU_LT]MDI9833236.1 hypothetical protein [Streptomyces sp. KAU_LT]
MRTSLLATCVVLALSGCGGTEMNCSDEAQCGGRDVDRRAGAEGRESSRQDKHPQESHTSSTPSPTAEAAFTEIYHDRRLAIGLPFPSECNSSVDFDEGRAWISDTVSPDDSELDLRACYIEFGQYVKARSAGFSDVPQPGPEECLGYARSGGLQTIQDWDEVHKTKPIKDGMTLCFETEAGNVARAEVVETRWKRYPSGTGDVYHRPFYTFKTTAWAPTD